MNPFYNMIMGGGMPQVGAPSPSSAMSGGPVFQNPMQKMNYILQAMQNPAAFVRQQFPDIPEGIQNDPGQIYNYLNQTRGPVSNQTVTEAQQMAWQITGNGRLR